MGYYVLNTPSSVVLLLSLNTGFTAVWIIIYSCVKVAADILMLYQQTMLQSPQHAPKTVRRQVCGIMFHVLFATYEVVGVLCWIWWFVHHCFLPNNVHLSCAHQHPERSHDTRYICLRCENLNISVYNACTTCMCMPACTHTHTHTHTNGNCLLTSVLK